MKTVTSAVLPRRGSRRWRSTVVILGALAAATLLTAAKCGESELEPEPDHAQVCVSDQTTKRVEDEWCDDSASRGTRWFYVPRGTAVPPVGETIDTTRGSYVRPTFGSVRTVSRGGFGGRGGSGGA